MSSSCVMSYDSALRLFHACIVCEYCCTIHPHVSNEPTEWASNPQKAKERRNRKKKPFIESVAAIECQWIILSSIYLRLWLHLFNAPVPVTADMNIKVPANLKLQRRRHTCYSYIYFDTSGVSNDLFFM